MARSIRTVSTTADTTDAECWERVANDALQQDRCIFKHKNAYYALPSVEVPTPTQPDAKSVCANPTGKTTEQGGTPTTMLPDADHDADEVNMASSRPVQVGASMEVQLAQTSRQTPTRRSRWCCKRIATGHLERKGTTTTTSTAIAVFTRQEAVVPIRGGSPNNLASRSSCMRWTKQPELFQPRVKRRV